MRDLCIFCNYAWPECFKKELWYVGAIFFVFLSIRYGLRTTRFLGFLFGIMTPLFRSAWVMFDADCQIDAIMSIPISTNDTNSSLLSPTAAELVLYQYKRIEAWLAFWIIVVGLDMIWILRSWIQDILFKPSESYKEKFVDFCFLLFGIFLSYNWTS